MSLLRVSLTMVVLVVLFACGFLVSHLLLPSGPPEYEPSNSTAGSSVAEPTRQPTPPWESKLEEPPSWARVYIDSSGSMAGFIGDESGPHAWLMRRLKDILVDAKILDFEAVRFGLRVQEPVKVSTFQQFGTDRKAYTKRDTYLAGAMEDALSWSRNGVILVLTDGVSSVTKDHDSQVTSQKKDSEQVGGDKPEPQSARTCALGSDTACLALRIDEYIQRGHGFWIVGFRFPFNGPYWVEEGGPKANRGKKLDKVKVQDRPFYVWIGGPDITQGRAIVQGLIRFAQKGQALVPFMAIEVAPGLWERWDIPPNASLEEIDLPRKEFCPRGGALLKTFSARESGEGLPALEVVTRERESFGVRLPLRSLEVLESADRKEVISLLQFHQELVLVLPQGLTSESVSLKWSLQPYEGSTEGRWQSLDLCVTAHPPAGLLGKDIDVEARWKGERVAAKEPPWDAWSTDTDDTPEAASRTVNLSIFFQHLLNQIMPEIGEGASLVTPRKILVQIRYK